MSDGASIEAITSGLRDLQITELTDRRLRQLARQLGSEWESLATCLGFSEAQIFKFKNDCPLRTEQQIFSMLVQWRHRNPSSPYQVEALSRQLREVGRRDLAEDLFGFSQDARRQPRSTETVSCSMHMSQKSLYCETCQELICHLCCQNDRHKRHQHVTVQEASERFKRVLKDQLQVPKADMENIDQSLASIAEYEDVLDSRLPEALRDVQDRLARAKEELISEGDRVGQELKLLVQERQRSLEKRRQTLIELWRRKSRMLAEAEDALQDSNSAFLARYTGIRQQVENLCSERLPAGDVQVAHPIFLPSPLKVDLGTVMMEDAWELSYAFGKRGRGEGEFEVTGAIAAADNPDEIAVTDWKNVRVTVSNLEGQANNSIPIIANDVVAVSNQWVCVHPRKIMVYQRDNTPAYRFSTVPHSVGKTGVWLMSVAVKTNGNIIVGDVKRKVLTEHRLLDGEAVHIQTIQVKTSPDNLAVLSNGWIVISDWKRGLAEIVAVTGGKAVTVSTISPTIDGEPAKYSEGVCYHSSGIYLAISLERVNTGHVHHYDCTGQFVSCVAQGLNRPCGLAFCAAGQQLAVADWHSVKIYRKVTH